MGAIPSDPRFADQWYLLNTGQGGGTAGIDLRVTPVWQDVADYSGNGILIAVLDDGVRPTQVDLASRYRADLSYDSVFDVADGSHKFAGDSHGTTVASFMVGSHNGLGMTGVAYQAEFTSLRIYGGDDSDDDAPIAQQVSQIDRTAADAFLRIGDADVVNNSWGFEVFSELTLTEAAMQTAVETGRGGLGATLLFAAGNERLMTTYSGLSGPNNSPYQITVGAADRQGEIGGFSSPGANVMVAAPGYEVLGAQIQPSELPAGADADNAYAETTGTSFATPLTSGVVALMYEANPGLGYRDVQRLLSYSAYDTNAEAPNLADLLAENGIDSLDDFTDPAKRAAVEDSLQQNLALPFPFQVNGADDWNGGGLTVDHDFGFGHVDAHAAVRLAEFWTPEAQTTQNLLIGSATDLAGVAIPDGQATGVSRAITVDQDMVVEHAVVDVTITGGDARELELILTSPSGTRAYLLYHPDLDTWQLLKNGEVDPTKFPDATFGVAGDDYRFMSVQTYGESALGNWTLTAIDTETGNAATLEEWTLSLYGGAPSDDDRYIFTSQYGELAAADPARATLTDVAGVDTLNAAALTTDSILDLRSGGISTIDGAALTLASGTVVEDAIGGDGDDTIYGNEQANRLIGARGNDWFFGSAGSDRYDGHLGTDVLRYEYSIGQVSTAAGADGALLVTTPGGTDELTAMDVLMFDGMRISVLSTGGSAAPLAFDSAFYLAQNPDVAEQGLNAHEHYLTVGRYEGRDPNALFDAEYYIAANPDLPAGTDAYQHYLWVGWMQGRNPSAVFDGGAYLAANADVAAAGVNPLVHYMTYGMAEGRAAWAASDPFLA